MSKSDPYFQFPIAMLRGVVDVKALVQDIVSYSIWGYASSLLATSPDSIDQIADRYAAVHDLHSYDPSDIDHQMALAASERLRITLHDVSHTVQNAKRVHSKFGSAGVQCRVRADIAWSAHDNEWPLDKFRVLCAVYAGIGDRGIAQLATPLIQALAAGHSKVEPAPKPDKPKSFPPKRKTATRASVNRTMLSEGGVRHWLDKLWLSNFFQYCKYGKDRWYSVSSTNDAALARAVRAKLKPTTERKKVLNAADPLGYDDEESRF